MTLKRVHSLGSIKIVAECTSDGGYCRSVKKAAAGETFFSDSVLNRVVSDCLFSVEDYGLFRFMRLHPEISSLSIYVEDIEWVRIVREGMILEDMRLLELRFDKLNSKFNEICGEE